MITRSPTSTFRRLANTEALARASARHPRRTIVCWLAIVAAAMAAAAALLGPALTAESDMTNNPELIRAQALIDQQLPQRRDAEEVVVVRSRMLMAADPAFRAGVGELRRSLLRTGAAVGVGDPYDRTGHPLISRDRHAAMLPVVTGAESRARRRAAHRRRGARRRRCGAGRHDHRHVLGRTRLHDRRPA
jgi:hypothetical protein